LFLLAIEKTKDIQEDNNFGNNEIERFSFKQLSVATKKVSPS
jgi:hypothetical protein